MKNYAIENGKKYFMYFDLEDDVMKVQDIAETGNKFTIYGEWMVNGKLCHASLHDAIESLGNYKKPVLYHGQNVNVWVPDIFLTCNKYTGEVWREYHFDSSVLDQLESVC